MDIHNPEAFAEWIKAQLEPIKLGLHQLGEDAKQHHQEDKTMFDAINRRLKTLEQLKSMIVGGALVLVALGPVLWWVLTKVVVLTEKTP